MPILVSVITPCFNGATFIAQYVHMLLAQTSRSWTAIIIDDHSTDHSFSLLTKLTKGDSRFLLLPNIYPKTPGPSSARNYAIRVSTTPYIAFCDIDDTWHPFKLDIQLNYHISKNLDLSVTSYARVCSRKHHQIVSYRYPPTSLTYHRLLLANPIPLSSVIVSRNLLIDHVFLPVKHEDYHLWLNIFCSLPSLRYGSLNLVLMFYRIHNKSLSADKFKMPSWVFSVYSSRGFSRTQSLFLVIRWCAFSLFVFCKETLTSQFLRSSPYLKSSVLNPPFSELI